MSPIKELIKEVDGRGDILAPRMVAEKAFMALPDLVRLVEWVEDAGHLERCDIVMQRAPNSIEDPPCSCGIERIQRLLEE